MPIKQRPINCLFCHSKNEWTLDKNDALDNIKHRVLNGEEFTIDYVKNGVFHLSNFANKKFLLDSNGVTVASFESFEYDFILMESNMYLGEKPFIIELKNIVFVKDLNNENYADKR